MKPVQAFSNATNAISSWFNRNSGMGGAGDLSGATFRDRPRLDAKTIEDMLRVEPLIRTAMEIMGEDIIRAWRLFPKEKGEITKFAELETSLDYKKTILRALYWAEAFGGAVIVPRYDANTVSLADMAKEFEEPEGSENLVGWKVYAPHHLKPHNPRTTGEMPYQASSGLPEYYALKKSSTTNDIVFHHSWTIPVFGLMSSNITRTGEHDCSGMFGDSRADLIFGHTARAIAGLQNLSSMLARANIDVMKVVGLAQVISNCNNVKEIREAVQAVLTRAESSIQAASNNQPIVLDVGEELEREGLGAGAAAANTMSDALMNVYVSSTRLPRTKLLGEQAKGLNNGGEIDLTHYYDRVDGIREDRVTRPLQAMDDRVAADRGIAAPMWKYGPLETQTPKDQAEIERKRAERDKIYSDLGIPFVDTKIAEELDRAGVYDFTDEELADIKATDGPIDNDDSTGDS